MGYHAPMIARITGTLQDLEGTTAWVELPTGITYEVMLPTFAAHRLGLGIGKPLTLYTLEFLESPNQGSTFVPRMAGFLTRSDRAFFELLTTVQGIGPKKALKVLAMAPANIAAAIAEKDAKLLQALPEIGKKMSETIVLELADKVERFLGGAEARPAEIMVPAKPAKGKKDNSAESAAAKAASPAGVSRALARDAVGALTALGENPVNAVEWVDRVMAQETPPVTVDAVVSAVYRMKGG